MGGTGMKDVGGAACRKCPKTVVWREMNNRRRPLITRAREAAAAAAATMGIDVETQRRLIQNQPPLEGSGEYCFPDGSKYVGTWQNFLPHGEGTMTWPSGVVYRGSFNAGQVDGEGQLSQPNPGTLLYSERGEGPQDVTYTGGFKQGCASGPGEIEFPLDASRSNPKGNNTRFEGRSVLKKREQSDACVA